MILHTKNGHQEPSLFQFSENLTTGTERSLELVKMISDASMSPFQPRMVSAESLTTLDTKSILKVQMAIDAIETLPGLAWLCKTQILTCMTVSGGILMRNLYGRIRDPFLNLNRAIVFMRPMSVWLKNGVRSISTKILQTTIWIELKKLATM